MRFLIILLTLLVGLGLNHAARAQTVDLNIITAIDASGSVMPAEDELQYRGLALGVTSPAFLDRLGHGDTGAVGFTVFAWSDKGLVTVIPWTVIRGLAEAEAVASLLVDRIPTPPSPHRSAHSGHQTALGGALEAAVIMAQSSPYQAPRTVINVLSDGKANNGVHPNVPQAMAAELGLTINAVLFGEGGYEKEYFEQHVITGTGAFVNVAENPEAIIPMLERKFWQDIIAADGPWQSQCVAPKAPRT